MADKQTETKFYILDDTIDYKYHSKIRFESAFTQSQSSACFSDCREKIFDVFFSTGFFVLVFFDKRQ